MIRQEPYAAAFSPGDLQADLAAEITYPPRAGAPTAVLRPLPEAPRSMLPYEETWRSLRHASPNQGDLLGAATVLS
jgi:hypothetical protein